MHSAVIEHYYTGCEFRFRSSSFKWCYYQSIHFARQAIYLHPYVAPIIIKFSNDMMIAVGSTGITIDTKYKTVDINKEGK